MILYKEDIADHSWEKGRIKFQMPAPWKPYSAIRARRAERLRASSNQTSWIVPSTAV